MARLATLLSSDGLLLGAAAGALAGIGALLLAVGSTSDPTAATVPTEGPAYRLTLSSDGQSAALTGRIDFGITAALTELLEQAAGLRRLRLESPGGRIAEARGLIALIERHGLDTAASGDCASACALVFAAGKRRLLEPGARLGFHRYGQHSPLVGVFLDPLEELEKDKAVFRRRGVSEAFLERIDATPHDRLWYPTLQELHTAGVVDRGAE